MQRKDHRGIERMMRKERSKEAIRDMENRNGEKYSREMLNGDI